MLQRIGNGFLLVASGVVIGALLTQLLQTRDQQSRQAHESGDRHSEAKENTGEDVIDEAKRKRDRLPSLIILVRHGESQGNADHTLYRTKPDNLVELTKKGIRQAHKVGRRVESIFKKMDAEMGKQQQQQERPGITQQEHGEGTSQSTTLADSSCAIRRVHLVVSPFERTRQTAAAMRPWFAHRLVRTDIQPRIREQEFGNLQGDAFEESRNEQKLVGRFWYRFPTGESGADVYDRVKSWWCDSVLNVNERYGYEPVDALVVVTHGLTMRFALMQLFGWSPTTFHSVWNAGNCDAYVLRKDLTKPGNSPYVLDEEAGDMPRSSINLHVEFNNDFRKIYRLNDYLHIPPPRTMQLDLVKSKLEEQYPEIEKEHIRSVLFMPFIDGAVAEGRTRCGRRVSLSSLRVNSSSTSLHNDSSQYQQPKQGKESQTLRRHRFHRANSRDESDMLDASLRVAQMEASWQF